MLASTVKRTICSFKEVCEPLNYDVVMVQRLSKLAKLPTRATQGSAGYDLYAAQEVVIKPQQQRLISTDLALRIPPGYYGRIASKSGIALCFQIDVHAGVVDSDYRGNVRVLLHNRSSKTPYKVELGAAVGQIIFEKIANPIMVEVENLDATNRGDKGFGEASKKQMP